ncbi:MAG: hypothetical protein AB1585_16065 [Thermodesulfobacteriota bacterium]
MHLQNIVFSPALYFFLLLGLIHSAAAQDLVSAPVPEKFKALYQELDRELLKADHKISGLWNGQKGRTAFSVELLAANSHQGEILLRQDTFQGILLTLDRLKDLGVQGISLGIMYPVLKPTFPRAPEYLDFYKRLSAEIKKRGFRLIVETTTLFPEPEFGVLRVDYTGLTLDQYKQEKRLMAETVLRELKPDFLSLDSEPLTQQRNTGVKLSVKNFTEVIQFVLKDLDRSGVKIGAGAGTWDDLSYFESLIKNTSLDYIDLHIYPLQRDFLFDRTLRIAELAKAHHKKLGIGETWLYKAAEREFAGLQAVQPQIFARDVFAFWAPLDGKFLEVMVKLSHHLQMEFCSFFWMRYLYGYVEYQAATKDLPPIQLFQLANRRAYRNIVANAPSLSGRTLKRLLSND